MKRALVLAPVLAIAVLACKKPKQEEPPPPTTISSAPTPVPPAAPFNATPVAQFADASLDGLTPLEQARAYKASGQLWMARPHLETRALSAAGTKEEAELLLEICMAQDDEVCIEKCGEKLHRKIKWDGGAKTDPLLTATPSSSAPEHKEPDTELARARDLVLKMRFGDARKILEPKVLDGKASREEVRMLKMICEREGDRMCVALCNTKLK